MAVLSDSLGRRFSYLRLSLTEACNFRCVYCLPDGIKVHTRQGFLDRDEIVRLIRALQKLGVEKVRLTGGEPTIRPDFIDIVKAIRQQTGIKTLALTTNGYQLNQRIAEYRKAGVDRLNVSIDSMNEKSFQSITGQAHLLPILEGLEHATSLGFTSVKVNSVILKDWNLDNNEQIMDWLKTHSMTWRFIELMRTNDNQQFFTKHHLSGQRLVEQWLDQGWTQVKREQHAGPAIEYHHLEYFGKLGLIAPYAKDFCTSCNRIRISAKGELRLCLFGDGKVSLRELLQHDHQSAELLDRITQLYLGKLPSHFLHQNHSGTTANLAATGG